jgi:hypothetical protein
MKKTDVAVLVVLLISGLLLSCTGVVTGSGNLETQEFNFSDFNKVEVSSAFEFEIVQSDSYRVSITADDNLFEHIQVTKVGETLKIGVKTISIQWPVTLKAVVTMPQIRGMDISGASKGSVSNFSSTENLDIEVSGAGSLELVAISAGDVEFEVSGASKAIGDITAGDVDFDVSGASTVQLEGSASDIVADVSGASRMKLAGFTVSNADVSLSGASNGTVNLSGKLDANLSGASKLEYIGEPTMGAISTSGASTLSKQ